MKIDVMNVLLVAICALLVANFNSATNIVIPGSGENNVCQDNGDGTCSNENTNVATPSESRSGAKLAKGSNEQGAPPSASLKECRDRYPQCEGYAADNQCEINPGWMIVSCPVSCNACHLLNPKVRCDRKFLNISTDPIYAPGDMDAMFSRIESEFGELYGAKVLNKSPWVLYFDHFLNDAECDAFIETSEGNWERSTDTGSVNEFGETGRMVSKSRTSSNAWCRHECESNPHVQAVAQRIEEITRIPYSHFESFQILHYEPGQYYRVHHDMAPRQNELACGPRVLTFFLYLSDVEEGGETNFPNIPLFVKPKRGAAVLWPSVMNDNLLQQDPRTHHAALPVKKGTKYAANSWIHLYDFQKSNLWGCTGTFDYL